MHATSSRSPTYLTLGKDGAVAAHRTACLSSDAFLRPLVLLSFFSVRTTRRIRSLQSSWCVNFKTSQVTNITIGAERMEVAQDSFSLAVSEPSVCIYLKAFMNTCP